GGSIEELWPFNVEIVARAIYSSPIPVVSAVGHERDTTISDLVSDVRVSTPSMVAESAIPNKAELIERVILYVKSMKSITKNRIYLKKEAIRRLLMLPLFRFPQKEIVENRRDLVMKKIEGIINSESRIYKKKRQELDSMLKRLSGLNPLSILNRGYTITYKYPENTPIRRKKDIGNETKRIKTVFYDGEIISQIDLEGVNYE
ncbi:MAG TPA: exodeoxyribonuclease VII large subunit, partial [Candidatus Atribacteria bacterium]|nr:exodeoxyribonuclease VII large subunit [Candidatus Atribacteria bacterium]